LHQFVNQVYLLQIIEITKEEYVISRAPNPSLLSWIPADPYFLFHI
jgi:hypothetical protein